MSKQVSAEAVFNQGLGDRYQTSDNFEGLLENAVATPIDGKEDIDGLEEAATNITATGQKPDLITVDEWAEKRGYQKPKDKENDNEEDMVEKDDDKDITDKEGDKEDVANNYKNKEGNELID